jgi:ADP-heptose:LPS heptosyltransferase
MLQRLLSRAAGALSRVGGECIVAGDLRGVRLSAGIVAVQAVDEARARRRGRLRNLAIEQASAKLILTGDCAVELSPDAWPSAVLEWAEPIGPDVPYLFGLRILSARGCRACDWMSIDRSGHLVHLEYGEPAEELVVGAGYVGMSRAAWEISGGFDDGWVGTGEEIEFSRRQLKRTRTPLIFCDALSGIRLWEIPPGQVLRLCSETRRIQDPEVGAGAKRVLIDYQGRWGLGDLVCSEPLVRGLRECYGQEAEIRYLGHAGNAAYAPEFDGAAPSGFQPDRIVEVKLFNHMSLEEYARLEALPSLVEHMCSYGDVSPCDPNPRLNLGVPEVRFLEKLQLDRRRTPLVAICSDGFDPYRSWPAERFEKLAQRIRRRGGTILELGLKERLGIGLDLVGKLQIREAAAAVAACDLFIGNNSSLLHYAQAGDIPCLAFFSLALPERFMHDDRLVLPVQKADLQCIDCMTKDFAGRNRRGCEAKPQARCMLELPLEAGLSALDLLFDEYLADCPRRGEEGARARKFRATVYFERAQRLLALGHRERAASFRLAAAMRLRPPGSVVACS